jgi:hypothetical protein
MSWALLIFLSVIRMYGSSIAASMRSAVGDEVGAEVAAVELHTLDVFGLEFQTLALFDGDDAVLADLVHDLGDQGADGLVGGGDAGHLGDLFLAS